MNEVPAPCRVKAALVAKYQEAVLAHSAKVVALQKKITSKDEFDALYVSSKEAQRTVASAREELGRHIAEHGC